MLLRVGDKWPRPSGATNEQLQFMTVCTEAWLLADADALRQVFKKKFDDTKLPPSSRPIESIDKSSVYDYLKRATEDGYQKNKQFEVLALVSPAKLSSLPSAKRFLDEMSR